MSNITVILRLRITQLFLLSWFLNPGLSHSLSINYLTNHRVRLSQNRSGLSFNLSRLYIFFISFIDILVCDFGIIDCKRLATLGMLIRNSIWVILRKSVLNDCIVMGWSIMVLKLNFRWSLDKHIFELFLSS